MEELVIDPARLRALKARERTRFAEIDAGVIAHAWFPRRPVVNILMLVDNGISFNQFYFGLSEVLDTLRSVPEGFVSFRVTRVHRGTDPNPPSDPALNAFYRPNAENFRFDGSVLRSYDASGAVASEIPFDINNYHQVWFFGFGSSQNATPTPPGTPPPPALTDAELGILFRWMDEKRGGVFATGDHATLGAALCSRIPRVRNMRKWTPADSPPPVGGNTRHDTSRPGHDLAGTAIDESAFFSFDDESDDVPQTIRPRAYFRFSKKGAFARTVHPILCGTTSRGTISVLPDHPHEGEVIVPEVLTDTLTWGAYTAREYPDLGSAPLSPAIIAHARILDEISDTNSFKGECNPREFGVIGALDGHRVKVGRVVTDSTWHHWFDVNLTGRMDFGTDSPEGIETGDTRKLNGFLDTPAGQAVLNKIRNYFRNVAIWLSPPLQQKQMIQHGLYRAAVSYPMLEEADPRLGLASLGRLGLDALSRLYGPCAAPSWLGVLVPDFPIAEEVIPRPEPDPGPLFQGGRSLREVEEALLGGVFMRLTELRNRVIDNRRAPKAEEVEREVQAGLKLGIDALIKTQDGNVKTPRGEESALEHVAQ